MIVDNSAWTVYRFRSPLVKTLKRQGYQVVVASPVDEYIHYLNETDFNKHIQIHKLNRAGKNPFQDLLFLAELFRLLRREKPDLVISFTLKPNLYSAIVCRWLSIPIVAVVTGLGYTFLHQKGIFRWISTLYKLALQRIEKLIVYNQGDLDFFVRNQIVPAHRCVKIPGEGIDTQHFLPQESPPEEQPFTFLFIGRLMVDKGILELIESIKILRQRNVRFACQVMGYMHYGNPSEIANDDLLAWVEEDAITYFGSTKDVRPYIAAADAIVLPSHREGLSRVILESMSMAKPVIVTDVPGLTDLVVHDENGLLVPVKNPAALADAMEYMTQLPADELQIMGQANRKKAVGMFDVQVSSRLFEEVVGEVMGMPENKNKHTSNCTIVS